MDERSAWPSPYSGLPALLKSVSTVLLVAALIVAVVGATEYLFLASLGLGILVNLLSAGMGVKIAGSAVILEYGFPKPAIRYVVRDVVDVFDVNELGRGRLLRYFKVLLVLFAAMMAMPVLYVVIRSSYPSPAYIPLMAIPLAMGLFLMLYPSMTAPTYRKFLRRAGAITAALATPLMAFVVGYLYRDEYGRSILSDPGSTALAIITTILLVIAVAALTIMAEKNHVIVVVDSRGRHYAIGVRGREAAEELMRSIPSAMRPGVGGDDAEAT